LAPLPSPLFASRTSHPHISTLSLHDALPISPIPGSDLPHVLSGDDLRNMMLGETSEEVKRKTSLLTRVATKIGAATGMTANIDRSEEHTSELQSRENLVCRLLLEKKNKTTVT